MKEYDPLLNPKNEPSRGAMATIDGLSWTLPGLAAALAIAGGIAALHKLDDLAAALGIVGGLSGALGIAFTNWASRIRDDRLAKIRAVGDLALDLADHASRQSTSGF